MAAASQAGQCAEHQGSAVALLQRVFAAARRPVASGRPSATGGLCPFVRPAPRECTGPTTLAVNTRLLTTPPTHLGAFIGRTRVCAACGGPCSTTHVYRLPLLHTALPHAHLCTPAAAHRGHLDCWARGVAAQAHRCCLCRHKWLSTFLTWLCGVGRHKCRSVVQQQQLYSAVLREASPSCAGRRARRTGLLRRHAPTRCWAAGCSRRQPAVITAAAALTL